MTFIMFATYASALLAIVVIGCIVHRLTCCAEQYGFVERFGLGLIAGGMTLIVGSLVAPMISADVMAEASPYNTWPRLLVWSGMVLYLPIDFARRGMSAKLSPFHPFNFG